MMRASTFAAGALGLGALAAVVILALLAWQHRQPTSLPAPTGPYAVGRADYDWVDKNRPDPIADPKGPLRELTVWIWYPAAPATNTQPAPYMPAPLRTALEQHMGRILKDFLTRDLSLVRAHAFAGAELAPRATPYPVLLLKPGIGALALDYTTLAEDLASHGYVVVASDSPHSTTVVVYQDGRIARRTAAGRPAQGRAFDELAQAWAEDDRFLLDHLEGMEKWKGRLDLEAVGAFGHSFGGAASLRFCSEDARCKAGVDLDGALHGDSVIDARKPFLFLVSEHASTPEDEAIKAKIRSVADRLPNRPSFLTLAGSGHFNFSDQALLKNAQLGRAFHLLGPIDQGRALAITADCLRAFFDRYLTGRSTVLPAYPELQPPSGQGPANPPL